MQPVILFRPDNDNRAELSIARRHLTVITQRTEAIAATITIGRYSVLPYYKELEKDLANRACVLVNSYREHAWVADFDYYEELQDFTFKTWHEREFYACQDPGPFIVKGRTNSKKHQWNKKMFAKNKFDACAIAHELVCEDPLIAQQGVIFRKYVPLEQVGEGLNGLPYAYEFRLFYYKDILLTHGFYWSIAENTDHKLDELGLIFAHKVANITKNYINFFVMDIARTKTGDWILVELNDAQMSGLSMCDPDELYSNLAKISV